MIAGIITTPNRQIYLKELVGLIAPQVDKLTIFNDEFMQGHTYNLGRAMHELLSTAKTGEQVLIMCDDVTTVPDWKQRFEAIHAEANGDIYCLFNRKPSVFTEDNLKRGWTKGVFLGGYYDHATIFINQQELSEEIRTWFALSGKYSMDSKKQKHFDNVIQQYLVEHGKEWVVTTPTLFDHIGEKSTLGHNIGGSKFYVGKKNEDI
jgi:hypothetical protein